MDHNQGEVPCGKFVPCNGYAKALTVSYKPNSDAVYPTTNKAVNAKAVFIFPTSEPDRLSPSN